ncbi:unnamed protein product [Ceratitis capitata]|uniref:(Mediterranean fruit fly) hypothetical protein n=1 Tax=Ceratitis capitata TaxID=7213 RepID=A0A811V5X1_CERCA|nr:unnamed protein product [Ceratitis capitata]
MKNIIHILFRKLLLLLSNNYFNITNVKNNIFNQSHLQLINYIRKTTVFLTKIKLTISKFQMQQQVHDTYKATKQQNSNFQETLLVHTYVPLQKSKRNKCDFN